jgi:hypothetical protein
MIAGGAIRGRRQLPITSEGYFGIIKSTAIEHETPGTIGDVARIAVFALAFCAAAASRAAQPIIDNERLTVWDITVTKDDPSAPIRHDHDFVTVYLEGGGAHKKRDAVFAHRGVTKLDPGERAVVIELKDHPVAPLANDSGYPLAFPRPHVKKIFENDRVIVWSYAWNPVTRTNALSR